jgi:hypothetical protein
VTIEVDEGVLNCVPNRLATWRADEHGMVVVERPKPESRGLRGLMDRLKWFMTYPRIRFDRIGSSVWQRMDGRATLAEIARAESEATADHADEMDQRVALFATALHHQGLIELRGSSGG